ncbi:hypothetical protein CcaverHIS002_0305340 [Cutaneotrichosporon cavernicola]|uniref:Major facilitator superfamily (MFS) profile domain-containing protein n=1 Tax=Cutaneotrichosporon cavernicola TaxID=279322 RepID=A0AA48I3I8_9TREE|nr:uncharacterized protein CcaverHIS019_0305310 [Cutaneotrichosporon cavernicola]BEI82666.1 hypothetical protein CcaverHIS002_0305340 [Cutaneotrichosporon cavernicola]BEI90461.1 hypothetical protein CcaverHIS019_0305310 [Cutaneotrichosporon cavernicola]BEI98235.1 hypothetical protein CcaverHIS631_0305340 [Cutaneotrichosporon cavernicola]BEJ06011.1 hypothetical protein CcaverHIS641_0305330 [Cutaneotrichosporon cavernicola]
MRFFGKNAPPADDNVVQESTEVKRKRRLGNVGTVFAAGSAMFSDGYSNASMGPVKTILKKKYGAAVTAEDTSLLSAMTFMGMIIGMFTFGYVSDKIGRKVGMYICTALIFIFSILSAVSGAGGASVQVKINSIIAFRTLLGIGLGGEYPSGSVTAAEATENTGVKKRSQQKLFVWATNTMLDIGFPMAWFVALVLLWIFGTDHLAAVWRGTFLLGAIPPLVLLIARIWMVEPELYTKNNMKRAPIPYWLLLKRYWFRLVGISIVWFIYDWITYPFGNYADTITTKVNPNMSLYETIGWGCLINAFYVPGTLVGSLIVDYLGPKYTLILGFVMQAIFGFALSGAYNSLTKDSIVGFAIMYGIFLSWGEVGPGNNLGLLATKAISPTAARGQLYGIAAAIGKAGAFIGNYTFPQIQASFDKKSKYLSNTGLFWVGSSLAIFAAIVAMVAIPNIGPDWMNNEDIEWRAFLERNGYDTSHMGTEEHLEEEAQIEAGRKKSEMVDVNTVPVTQ